MTDTTEPAENAEQPKRPRYGGRVTKLTPELTDEIVKLIGKGYSKTQVAAMIRVHRSTLYDWLEKGETEDADDLFREFHDRVTEAEAQRMSEMEDALFRVAIGGIDVYKMRDGKEESSTTLPDGDLLLKILERLYPERWRPVKALEVTGADGGPVEMTVEAQAVENVLGRLANYRKRKASEEARQAAADSAFGGDPAQYDTPGTETQA
ncbi:helix-turn-helix domain-containing protein (plasmid) [Microtetraspora malaysiensis]|uniref:helix-turn-helix domain-containing protein n=1 Tax=Microtetraspora malaysiensis TaxID=161358 RepID=UPI003D9465BE